MVPHTPLKDAVAFRRHLLQHESHGPCAAGCPEQLWPQPRQIKLLGVVNEQHSIPILKYHVVVLICNVAMLGAGPFSFLVVFSKGSQGHEGIIDGHDGLGAIARRSEVTHHTRHVKKDGIAVVGHHDIQLAVVIVCELTSPDVARGQLGLVAVDCQSTAGESIRKRAIALVGEHVLLLMGLQHSSSCRGGTVVLELPTCDKGGVGRRG
mmetsp:Transcript_45948/g.114214  ORF Transcript_45948/g.114214 Transcript_45948/m.114214 type:complete len:208 (+) Transcript_45948:993-1616(+)